MNLKQFVSESLTEICEGVNEAASKVKALGGEVNPSVMGGSEDYVKSGRFMVGQRKIGTTVAFDVAVTVTEGTETKGGIGILSGVVNLGSSGQSKDSASSATRIKFEVPITLP
jgi:hypothetical protein